MMKLSTFRNLMLWFCAVLIIASVKVDMRLHREMLHLSSEDKMYYAEPSQVQLCRALSSSTEHAITEKNEDDIVVIEEDFSLCRNEDSYSSLLSIFASALLAQIGQISGQEIYYRLNCDRNLDLTIGHPSEAPPTIQQMLPSRLTFAKSDIPSTTVTQLKQSCDTCLRLYMALIDEGRAPNEFPFTACLLNSERFPKIRPLVNEGSEPHAMMERVVEQLGSMQYQSNDTRTIIQPTPEIMLTLLPSMKKALHMTAMHWRAESTPKEEDGAVIFLDCASNTCRNIGAPLIVPFYIYAQEIPFSVTNIRILVSGKCSTVKNCARHGRYITHFLGLVYPEKSVTFDIVHSTFTAYSRMMLARQLISPPTLSTILPMLSRDEPSTTIQRSELYPWLDSMWQNQARTEIQQNHLLGLSGMSYISEKYLPTMATALAGESDSDKRFQTFMMQTPSHPHAELKCNRLRGRLGKWVQDMDYAVKAQYAAPLVGYAGKRDRFYVPTAEEPYRPETTYRWVDAVAFQACQTQLMTRKKMCDVLSQLDVSRVLFVGDSLSYHWSQSFWKLMGFKDSPGDAERVKSMYWDRKLNCSATGTAKAGLDTSGNLTNAANSTNKQKEIIIQFIRNDMLNDNLSPVEFGKYNCGTNMKEYCSPWIKTYKQYEGRTLLLANFGAHIHSEQELRRSFDAFIELVELLDRPDDLVVFRTTSPGHKDCMLENIRPYQNYSEYAKSITDKYDWDKFAGYNDYISRQLEDRRLTLRKKQFENHGSSKKTRIELLDIYPMTILRPDGHCKAREKGAPDCLHYTLPGPVDWWNHLLYSNLKDIASENVVGSGSRSN